MRMVRPGAEAAAGRSSTRFHDALPRGVSRLQVRSDDHVTHQWRKGPGGDRKAEPYRPAGEDAGDRCQSEVGGVRLGGSLEDRGEAGGAEEVVTEETMAKGNNSRRKETKKPKKDSGKSSQKSMKS